MWFQPTPNAISIEPAILSFLRIYMSAPMMHPPNIDVAWFFQAGSAHVNLEMA